MVESAERLETIRGLAPRSIEAVSNAPAAAVMDWPAVAAEIAESSVV